MKSIEKALEKFSPEDFEHLIFSLLHREGFMNCSWHERETKGDRDIICYKFTIDGPPELFQKHVVLCKPDKSSLSKYSLGKDILQIKEYDPYGIIIAANIDVSDYKKKVITDLGKDEDNRFQVLLWEQKDLLELIEKYQDLRLAFFGIPIDDLSNFPAMKNIFQRYKLSGFSKSLEMLLKQTFKKCIQDSVAVTIASLLLSYMEEEETLVREMVAGNNTLKREMQDALEEILSNQPEIDFSVDGIRLTGAFVKTLILANRLSEVLQRPSLDEKVFLYTVFWISNSETIKYISNRFPTDTIRSMEGALFCQFDIDEQDSLKRFFAECSNNIEQAMSVGGESTGERLDFDGMEFCLDDTLIGEKLGKEDLFVVDMGKDSGAGSEVAGGGDRTGADRHEDGVAKDHGHVVIEADRGDQNLEKSPIEEIDLDRFKERPGLYGDAQPDYKRHRIQFVSHKISKRVVTSYNYEYDMALDNWLSKMLSYMLYHYKKFSDIFIFPEKPIQMKTNGKLQEVELDTHSTSFSHFQAEAIACMLLNKAIAKGLLKKTSPERSISFIYQMKGHQRFRVTIMTNAMGDSIVFRKIHPPLWSGENLFLNDPLLSSLLDVEDGLIIVAGKPSSGKTTLMNAMINAVNQKEYSTIVTLENPVEAFHAQAFSSIMQLQKGIHFFDYEEAAVAAIKSGADVMVIDELQDGSTCRAAFEAARLGLRAVATINAKSCREAFDRILYLCGADADPKMESFLVKAIKRIICLTLEPNEEGELATSFETIDLAQEMEKFEPAANPGRQNSDTAENTTSLRIDDKLDAVFDTSIQRPAGS